MKERAFPRRTINIQADFIYDKVRYAGTVMNLSKKGMYINTELRLPLGLNLIHTFFKPELEIIFPFNGNILKVPLKVRRFVKTDGLYNGIGADVYNPPENYFVFINSL